MPKVERVFVDGHWWNRYPDSKRRSDRVYFKRSIHGGTEWLHRRIWEDAHGTIPKGCHIHHKDGNPDNNDISNLECLTVRAHVHKHPYTEKRLAEHKVLLDEIRGKTKEWHASPEGHEWHSKHAKAIGFGRPDLPERKCENCGNCSSQRQITTSSAATLVNQHGAASRASMMSKRPANGVEGSLPATNTANTDFVVLPVERNTLRPCGSTTVYDLTVEGAPEFFASGILVHNCIDALRYALDGYITKPGLSKWAALGRMQ